MRPKIKPKERLKICFVITKSVWGGAQRYVFDLATHLPTDHFEVTVAAGGNGPLVGHLNEAGIRRATLPHAGRDVNIWQDILTFFNLFFFFRREQPDIVHLNSSKIGGLGALAARLTRVPKIIFTAHGWAFNEDRPSWQKKLITFAHWLTTLLCHTVITVAEAERKQVRHWPWVQDKFVTIYNGVDPLNFLYRDTAREELSIRESNLRPLARELWIGTIGELHRNKDLINAIGAVALARKEYPDIRFVIIGEGEQRNILTRLIRELGLENHVFLLGTVPQAARYLKAFDIFLLNSRKEGLPYVILEAGLATLPVVATNIGGIPEIISTDRVGVLVPPENPEATAEVLIKLIANNLEREILGRNLESKVRARFSTERMVLETIKLYND